MSAIDLLARVEVPRDAFKEQFFSSEWTREGQTLVSPPDNKVGRITVPFQPPPEYELTAVVERVDGADGVVFGVIVDGQRCLRGAALSTDEATRAEVEWRNELFERCDPATMQRLPSAQPHARPKQA